MGIGAFSVSLAVEDLGVSRAFYERLGFETMGGAADQGWLILKSGPTVIGLFQGMFEGNLLTFNPGWDQEAQPLDAFEDVRTLQARLKSEGITFVSEAEPDGTGPASFVISDPDGNRILVDQHVPPPG